MARVVGGLVFLAIGFVWILQGSGELHGSFMTGSGFWLFMGIVFALIGLMQFRVYARKRST